MDGNRDWQSLQNPGNEQELGRTAESERQDRPLARQLNQLAPEELIIEGARQYVRQHPGWIALGAFSIGFILGWKLKPW